MSCVTSLTSKFWVAGRHTQCGRFLTRNHAVVLGFRCLRYPQKPTAVLRRHPLSGTVPWFSIPELMDNYECTRVDDVKAMTNNCLFKLGSHTSWYVQAGLRFFMKLFINYHGAVEVRVSEPSTSEVDFRLAADY